MTPLVLPEKNSRGVKRDLQVIQFAKALTRISRQIGFRMSSRGWAYQLEGFGLINKSQFDVVEGLINDCRKDGTLPYDFTMEEEGRKFSGVEEPDYTERPEYFISRYLRAVQDCERYYTPDWWEDENYYIQMVVEKIDLKTLFEPVCKKFHIPIATTKGWGSILQRAEYGRRFKEAEENGKQCILLTCGDHDPDGLRISEGIRKNLEDLADSHWMDGTEGYDPSDLIIHRFGLNYNFIIENNLTWIDNLMTGSGKSLADPKHKNHNYPYVQEYLKTVGVRKCEANALVVRPEQAAKLCRDAIEAFLGVGAEERFVQYRINANEKFRIARDVIGINESVQKILPDMECWYNPWRSYDWELV